MRNQSIRLILYSSLAILALTLVWGFRSIPKQAEMNERTVKSSVEQEILTLQGAVKASTQALKYRLLDVLKAEGNDHSTRTFHSSPFIAATLLELDQAQNQWKSLWHSSKTKAQFQSSDIRSWMSDWPLSKLGVEDVYFTKVGDWQGQPYYAVLAPVRRPNNIPMVGVGIFPANQFGLILSADRAREVRVFDDKGFALALARPAYIGSSVKREPVVDEALNSDEAIVRHEWKANSQAMFGVASKVPGGNLFVSVDASLNPVVPYKLGSWLYLVFGALGAIGLNWYLFYAYNKPLLESLEQQERSVEQLKRQLVERPTKAESKDPVELPTDMPLPQLANDMNFIEPEPAPSPAILRSHTLHKVVQSALRSLEPRMRDLGIRFAEKGLQSIPVTADVLQLQTAIEEVMKNGIEAMQFSEEKWLTISGNVRENKVRLTVEDTGGGITKENLSKVFDPFFSTKDSEGVARGLGLNVARRVVEEMKGQVTVESLQTDRKSGTTVTMEWPLEEIQAEVALPSAASEPSVDVATEMSIEDEIKAEAAANMKPDAELLSELDLLADEYEVTKPVSREWPDVAIRKPIVRTLD